MGADYHNQHQPHWINELPVANPMSIYEEYKAKRTSWGINALGTVVVEVELTDGTVGIAAASAVSRLATSSNDISAVLLKVRTQHNVELIWDQMWRATMPTDARVSRSTPSVPSTSLWDCLGKLLDEPIYALIGGKTKSDFRSTPQTSRPDLAKDFGFQGAKIPCRYGPADGIEGLKKNVRIVAEAREQVGEDFPLRLDCYMSLTVPYAIELAKALAPFKLHWMEECLPPDD
jgi:L-rhamnonate dehydratase